ncbi:MAG: alpha-glucan family phosphorylase [Anaerolineae bacterium]|nr:alpha-glucan family phosphorylase [Anaerolineae bacterium]
MVKPIATVSVVPKLPEPLERLRELAYNVRWSWHHDTINLFRRLDRDLWEESGHNPVMMLGSIDQRRLDALVDDSAFISHFKRVCNDFDAYMAAEDTWYSRKYGKTTTPNLAYFSMEFGLTEALQNYSGGLGVLSGDHLKSASDLGLPLVGVGLLYQEGYFRQYLSADGFQQELYPMNDFANMPVTTVTDADGDPLVISVALPGRDLYAHVRKVQVGRIPLYLLDSNVPENSREEDRNLTDRLYGGDKRTRIRQELLVGIGGIRALNALGIRPQVCHINEGHSAFLTLERARQFMNAHGVDFWEARDILSPSNVFTIHTPVPAGLERFGLDLMAEHFREYNQQLGISWDEFLSLGREHVGGSDVFALPVLALNMSGTSNGVAKLHGVVSRKMWQWMYPNVPESEIPIDAVTNGIHTQTWLSADMGELFDRYLNPRWRLDETDSAVWADVEHIPDTELWRTHVRRRERLIAFTRERLHKQLARRGAPHHEIEEAEQVLDPDALTIGFARRFATYKRATMVFSDMDRLLRLVNDPDRPVQFVFAGKAHPHDTAGKEFIRSIVNLARTPELRHRLVFLEDYDMNVARYLVQGVDVWLNNPRRPKEASGTSGMKVIYNGGLNFSILDGWWDEAYSPEVGWAIGSREEYSETQERDQDQIESEALYNVLEHDIVPLFYDDRTRDNLPRGWIRMMKDSIKQLAPVFNTHRMVQEYTDHMYIPSRDLAESLITPSLEKGRALSSFQRKVRREWGSVSVRDVQISESTVAVGSQLVVRAAVTLGHLTPDEVQVQMYSGRLTTRGEITGGECHAMSLAESLGGGAYIFDGETIYQTSGERGVSVRILPKHESLLTPFLPGLIRWAGDSR